MNIAFLKNLMGSGPEAMTLPSTTGMVPAFPEDMIFEDQHTETGSQLPISDSDSLADMPEFAALRSADTISLNIKASDYETGADQISKPMELVNNLLGSLEEPVGSLPATSSDNSARGSEPIKLSDIDPAAKILPFVNATSSGSETAKTQLPTNSGTDSRNAIASTAETVTPEMEAALEGEPKFTQQENGKHSQIPVGQTNGAKEDVNVRFNRADPDSARANQTGDRHAESRTLDLSRAASSVDQGRPVDVKSDTGLPNMPAQLLQSLKQLHASPTRGLKDLAVANEKADMQMDAEQIQPDTLHVEEIIKRVPLAGLSGDGRMKRTSIGETVAALASAGIKDISAAMNRVSDVAATKATTQASVESFLDFDAHFIENLAREIGNIAQSRGIARFSLRPEHLGRVDIEIHGGENGDEIKLTAETDSVRQFLAQAQSKLEQEARLQGQRLIGVEIETALHQNNKREMPDSDRSGNRNGNLSEESQETENPRRRRSDLPNHSENNARFA